MQQYVQMLSKGTVDMQSWRTLQETMPVAMDKVAKSFKDQGVNSVSELYDALQSGKITFDDFNSRLIKLNGGVGGFAELAKKNSAGIKTSFSNVKTAVVKGLKNVLSAIDNGMKNAGLGSIAQNFDKLKTVVNQVFSAITKAIPPIVATFKTLFDFINQNKDWLGPLIAGITAGVAAYKLWKGAITAWNTVTKIATAVQVAFNAVMDANPIMLIVIAIAAVVAGFVYFFTQTETGKKVWASFVDFLKTAWDSVVTFFSGMGQWFSDIWTTVVNTVQSLWGAFTTWVINMAKSIVDGIVNGWNSFKQGTVDLWNATIQWIKDTWASFKQWVVDSANAIVNGVKQGWENLKQGTIDLWNGMINGLKGIWDGLKQSVRNLIDNVKTTFNNLTKINLLDIGKAIIDGLVKGLKKKWEDGMKFISGIGDWIRKHKGPIRVDRKLLIPAGNAIMNGLNSGLTGGFRDVQSNVSGMGDMIANAINSDYSVDIGANVAAANRSISSQVSHDVNLNQGKQPAYVTLKLGSQEYKAFVDDISGVQGLQSVMMNKF